MHVNSRFSIMLALSVSEKNGSSFHLLWSFVVFSFSTHILCLFLKIVSFYCACGRERRNSEFLDVTYISRVLLQSAYTVLATTSGLFV